MVSKKVLNGFNEEGSEDEQSLLSFRGNFTHQIDIKNRISLPVEFRKILENANETHIVLTNYISDGARCIEAFPGSSWLKFENKLRKQSRFDSKLQKLENFYLSRSAQCSMDSAGRILIPNHLKNYAGLEKEAVFTASIHGFRIWEPKVWEIIFSEAETMLLENPDIFKDIDL